jgi:murein DD-endopeptidase MepM/ murein hydrolase activator NlpD
VQGINHFNPDDKAARDWLILVVRAGVTPRLYRMSQTRTTLSLALLASLLAGAIGVVVLFGQISAERDALNAQVAALNTRVSRLDAQLKIRQQQIITLETTHQQTQGKLAQAEAQVKRFGTQARAIQGQVAALQAQVSRVESVAGTDAVQVARASVGAAALSGDPVKSLESLYAQLNAADRRVKGAIETLEKQADQEMRIPSGWPVEGVITSTFGFRFGPRSGKLERHGGWDIATASGTPVLASASGKVIAAGFSNVGYGLHVVLDHGNGLKTLYGHLSQIDVKLNDEITLSTQIGLVGSTGNSTGPHLHYEVRLSDVPVDPGPFLDRARPEIPLLEPATPETRDGETKPSETTEPASGSTPAKPDPKAGSGVTNHTPTVPGSSAPITPTKP